MDFLIFGINHRTAELSIREALVFNQQEIQETLETIKSDGVVPEVMILSTCNRTEIYGYGVDKSIMENYLQQLVRVKKQVLYLSDENLRYRYFNRDAVKHCFRVAAGLDSMILGEPQILGQLKQAYTAACNNGTNGPFVNRLCHMAFRVGKRARTETEIGLGAVSVSSAAIKMIEDRIGSFRDRKALLIGAGKMGELTARHILSRKVSKLYITSRNEKKARDMALRLGGETVQFSRFAELLKRVDIVISSTSAPDYIITREMVSEALEYRPDSELFFVDIAVPRDVEPGVTMLENVVLYDIDSLNDVVNGNIDNRGTAVEEVESIIEESTDKFLAWFRSLQVVPIIQSIRKSVDDQRIESLDKMKKHFPEEDLEKLDYFSKNLMEKFLRTPMEQIKLCDRSNHVGLSKLVAICDLFDLKPEKEDVPSEKRCRWLRLLQQQENSEH